MYETIQIDDDYITLDGNEYTITGSDTGFGVFTNSKTGVTIKNLKVNNFSIGICTYYSVNVKVTDNTASNNTHGIGLCSSSSSTFKGNTVSNNGIGFYVDNAFGNIVTNNTILDNSTGILMAFSSGNIVYNNNFINNAMQALDTSGGNAYNLAKPVGGNYWSNYDTPAEGCNDSDSDGFCDAPYYILFLQQDNLPWTEQDGWVFKLEPLCQCDSQWGNSQYNGSGIDDTICSEGCALVSLTMLLQYYGVDVDVLTLNEWMVDNDGFTEKEWVKWWAVEQYPGANIEYIWEDHGSQDFTTLDSYLEKGYPVILSVKDGSHFVLAVSKTDDTYTLYDPGSCISPITTLKEKYNNNFDSMRPFEPK